MFKRLIYIMAAASFIFGGIVAKAQDAGALLDLLVRKKIITDQEAEEVRAELTKEAAPPADESRRIRVLFRIL